jgi:hypothetical protein
VYIKRKSFIWTKKESIYMALIQKEWGRLKRNTDGNNWQEPRAGAYWAVRLAALSPPSTTHRLFEPSLSRQSTVNHGVARINLCDNSWVSIFFFSFLHFKIVCLLEGRAPLSFQGIRLTSLGSSLGCKYFLYLWLTLFICT